VKPKVVDGAHIGSLTQIKKLDCCHLILSKACWAMAAQQVIQVLVFGKHDLVICGCLGYVEEEIRVIIPDGGEIDTCVLESLIVQCWENKRYNHRVEGLGSRWSQQILRISEDFAVMFEWLPHLYIYRAITDKMGDEV
jgi:hypothetical protein